MLTALGTFSSPALLAATQALAVPLSYDVVDVYSSYTIGYFISGTGATQTLHDVSRSGLSASIGTTFDFGFFYGTQYGEISASPNDGTVTTSRYHTFNLLTPVPGANYQALSGAFIVGKDLVVGRFTVPDVGAASTTVLVDIAFAGNYGDLKFLIGGDEASYAFAPGPFTPWESLQSDYHKSFSFSPGSSVLFGFGGKTETGVSGVFANAASFAYAASVKFGQLSLSYVNPIPEPSTLALLAFGLVGLEFSRRKRAG